VIAVFSLAGGILFSFEAAAAPEEITVCVGGSEDLDFTFFRSKHSKRSASFIYCECQILFIFLRRAKNFKMRKEMSAFILFQVTIKIKSYSKFEIFF